LDFSGPPAVDSNNDDAGSKYPTEPMQQPLHAVAAGATPENSDSWSDDAEGDLSSTGPSSSGTPPPGTSVGKKKMGRFRRTNKAKGENSSDETSQNASDSLERVINVKNCPLCHRPRLNSKAEIDIVTHLAICASQDWNKVDRIVVGNFVTASQAQRKWYTKVISMVSSGDYKLGAVYILVFSFFIFIAKIFLLRIPPISLFRTEQRVNWKKKRCKFMLDWG
jgi:phosphatidylserine decarboxylase